MASEMTGAELRVYVESRGMTVNAFQERVVRAYLTEVSVSEKAATRHVKRWFSEAHTDKTVRPGDDWRRAVRSVLGDDPFAVPNALLLELHRRNEQLQAEADEQRATLEGILQALKDAGIRVPPRQAARRSAATAQPASRGRR